MVIDDQESGISVLRSVRRTLRTLIAATVVLYILIGGLAGYAISKANTTENSLCALRVNAQEQIVGSQQFLQKHPEGIRGISPAVIQAGIDRQRAVVEALSTLSCEAPSEQPAQTTG